MPGEEPGWDAFDLVVGGWRLGLTSSAELPAAAVDALVAGHDTPHLRRLAGLERHGHHSDIVAEVDGVFRDRRVPGPSTAEARKRLVDEILADVGTGRVAPSSAAAPIYRLAREADGRQWRDLKALFDLAADLPTASLRGLDQAAIEAGLIREARALLDRGGLSPA